MNTNSLPYIEILPDEPRHRQLIAVAMKAGDKPVLAALKGNTSLPIHFVTNWFFYALMQNGHEKPDAVVIYSPQTRLDMAKANLNCADSDKLPVQPLTIPVNTYDDLLL